jgi:hypothetical protein
MCSSKILITLFLLSPSFTAAFLFETHHWGRRLNFDTHHQHSSQDSNAAASIIGVVAPLVYIGPYPCLGLKFPHLNPEHNSIHFVMDTGANVNSISKDLAHKLDVSIVKKKEDLPLLGSTGAGGSLPAGDFVMLGDCQLSGMPKDQENLTFMTNLTAAAMNLGIVEQIGGGILGTCFFYSFPAGVEFDWYGTDGDPPTFIFYYGTCLPEEAKKNAKCVSLEKDSFFGIPTIIVSINGVEFRAIIDTGSPITIISPSAAKEAKIERRSSDGETVLKIKGIDDGIMGLSQAQDNVSIQIGNDVTLQNMTTIFVGELPGLSSAGAFSSSPYPQLLLGLDALRHTYRTIFRLAENEIWFEPLPVDKMNK